jgi:RNA polymerase sigma-70 factor (sigma-E family)
VSVGGDHGGQGKRQRRTAVEKEKVARDRPGHRGGMPGADSDALAGSGDLNGSSGMGGCSKAGTGAGAVPRQFAAVGSGQADFREYVNSRGRALLRAAYLLTGNLADAEDLVQSALAKTYQAWDRIQDRAAIDGYVRRAMVNTQISWWRRRKVDEFPTDEIPDQPVADTASSSELHDTLQRAIDRLPQRMRAAVVLRFFEDMTEAEVADVLGVSQGTVKSTVSRAVAKLRADADLLAE